MYKNLQNGISIYTIDGRFYILTECKSYAISNLVADFPVCIVYSSHNYPQNTVNDPFFLGFLVQSSLSKHKNILKLHFITNFPLYSCVEKIYNITTRYLKICFPTNICLYFCVKKILAENAFHKKFLFLFLQNQILLFKIHFPDIFVIIFFR